MDQEHRLNLDARDRDLCRDACCATPVAISLWQDDHHIINSIDGHDLADVAVQHYKHVSHQEFFSTTLTPELAPCLQPGVIIQIDNHGTNCDYFFKRIRPNITVPYLVISSKRCVCV